MEAGAPVVRDNKGRLAKGSALNPGGHSAREARMLRDLRALGPRAIAKLGKLLDDPNASVALGAAKEILDRNLGKVKQQVQVDVTSTHVLHLQALEELAERKRRQIIEAQAIDITPHATLDRKGLHDCNVIELQSDSADLTEIDMSATAEPPPAPRSPRGGCICTHPTRYGRKIADPSLKNRKQNAPTPTGVGVL